MKTDDVHSEPGQPRRDRLRIVGPHERGIPREIKTQEPHALTIDAEMALGVHGDPL